MMSFEEATRVIGSIRFTLLSPNDVRKLSTVEIREADTYDDDGVPVISGLMDGRLGTLEPKQKCKTCGNTAVDCPGHSGHIELAEPVVHFAFAKIIHKFLSVTCRSCGRILLSDERIGAYKAMMSEENARLNEVSTALLDKIVKEAKKSQECPQCGARQYAIEHQKPTTFVDETGSRLTPSAVREMLERIPDDDLRLLGMDPTAARPEWMILQVLLVPPVNVRPSITLESGIRSEDDMTHKLVDIIRINQKLHEALESGVPVNIVQELHDLLQYHVTTYFDNEATGLPPARHRSGRALRTISQRLKGKEGRFRGNLSGKRVDFSARTVISPDPNLDINEVGVPVDIAARLTIPERVTEWNIEKMRDLVRNGPDQYPGALYIVRSDQRRVRLEFVADRNILADTLEPGATVERHLRDDDIVLFNRQPSLHRMSIMAHTVRVLPYKTFRMNPCVCPPYNADFDGDEMNLHVPQGEEARTEARVLMQVQDQILSPRYGGPIIGAKTDLLSAAYMLTRKSTFLTKDEMCKLLTANDYTGPLPEPAVKRPVEMWTGKQLFSLFLPRGFSFAIKSSMTTKDEPGQVTIRNGRLEEGVIDKNSIGAERSETLFHRIIKDYGSEAGREFLKHISRLLSRFMMMRGFSYSFSDLDIPAGTEKDINQTIQKSEERVYKLIDSYNQGTLERLPGQSLIESLEINIMDELSKARDAAGECVSKCLEETNSGAIMTRTGARGSALNITQMMASVGQQSIRGQRILRGYVDRVLTFFRPGDAGPMARGFVYSSYRDGLRPIEYFFHAMGGREGLVDTAVRTQQSGYMQRRLINALEHLRVEYDSTVRDSRGDIVQFRYGEDGIDTAKSDHGKAVNTERLVARIKLTAEKGTKASTNYINARIKETAGQVPPLLADELKKSLLKAKLSRRAVDEAVRQALENYDRALIEPGEAAGIVSAQSIGEPGTQMTLRTFHFAGVREQNVTLGLPRLIEIVDARRNPSTPTMTVFLDEKHRTREKAEEVATRLTRTTLGDIASSIESDITRLRIVVKLDIDAMHDKLVTMDDLKTAVQVPHGEVTVEKDRVEISTHEMNIEQFRRLESRVTGMHVKGIPGVKRALVTDENHEWIIRTEGSDLKRALTTPGVDPNRTTSNNMHEVAAVLGIEAARNVIIKEAKGVLDEQGLDVDTRHVMLVADAMTASGEILQVGRHGISGEKASTLAKAAFEITVPTIVDAAISGTRDYLRGVAENVIVGQQIPMGTGLIDILFRHPGAASSLSKDEPAAKD